MTESKDMNGIGSQDNIREKTEQSKPMRTNECPICDIEGGDSIFYCMTQCKHRICILCVLNNLLSVQTCATTENPEYACCREDILPIDAINIIKQIKENNITIKNLIEEPQSLESGYLDQLLSNYEDVYFSLIPIIQTVPGIVTCPGNNCNFPVITFGAAWKCSKVTCKNKKCGLIFCLNCKIPWGKSKECMRDEEYRMKLFQKSSCAVFMKACPVCACPVCRGVDLLCNHLECTICQTKFCFICSKRADYFHYIMPFGCPYYGTIIFSTKKTCLFILFLMVFSPLILLFIVIILIPCLLFCIPKTFFLQIDKMFSNIQKRRIKKLNIMFVKFAVVLLTPIMTIGIVAVVIIVPLVYIYILSPILMIKKLAQIIKNKIVNFFKKPISN